jgi:hypothetical protein
MYYTWKRLHAPESRLDRRAVLDVLYSGPLESDERYFHEDLEGLTQAELSLERERLVSRLRVDYPPDPWLLGRLDKIDRRLPDAT